MDMKYARMAAIIMAMKVIYTSCCLRIDMVDLTGYNGAIT